jgi:hypothetical protein
MENILKSIQSIEILIALIGVLLTIVGAMAGLIIWYLKSVIKKASRLNEKIGKNTYSILDLKDSINGVFSSLHSSEKSVWEELVKLRRTLVSGTMVLRGRKKEIGELLADQRRVKSKLEDHQKILAKGIKTLKIHNDEFKLIRTKLHNISKDIFIIKDVKDE